MKWVRWEIVRIMVLNQTRQEFATVVLKLKEIFGIAVPAWVVWTVAVVLQNSVFVMIAYLVLGSRGIPGWWVLAGLALLFNLYMPSTMARRDVERLRNDPLRDILKQSPWPDEDLTITWLLGETACFWIRHIGLQFVSVAIILDVTGNLVLGFGIAILWIAVVSGVYLWTLYRHVYGPAANPYRMPPVLYIISLTVVTGLLWFVSDQVLTDFADHPISVSIFRSDHAWLILPQALRARFSSSLSGIWEMFIHHKWLGWLSVAFFCTFLALYIVVGIRYRMRAAQSDVVTVGDPDVLFRLYHLLARHLFPRNPFIWRDLLWIQRFQNRTQFPLRTELWLPPSISSAVAVSVVSWSLKDLSAFVLIFWAISLYAVYQSLWFMLWSFPILYPSSELRQVDLLNLSPNTSVRQMKIAKIALLGVLGFPLLLELSLIFLIGAFSVGFEWLHAITGLIGLWLIYLLVTVLSGAWMFVLNRVDYPNIFSIQLVTMETKFFQFLYQVPRRLLSTVFVLLFLTAYLFNDHHLNATLEYSTFLGVMLLSAGLLAVILPKGERYTYSSALGDHLYGRMGSIWLAQKSKIFIMIGIYISSFLIGMLVERKWTPPEIRNPGITALTYLVHNLETMALMIVLGSLSYGVVSLLLLGLNGAVAGIAVEILEQKDRLDLIWKAFLPHAIFEIPATLLSAVIPFMVWSAILHAKRTRSLQALRSMVTQEVVPMIVIAVILFVIAAFMEAQFGL
ncbi:stage II sporulation protein M [Kyrpidia spormannii]|nr:stage II sporulation protein M [Kyrpidia spormannii]